MIESYKDLKVWQRSMDLVCATYSMSQALPREELFGLTSQMRRSAVSIPSNIAEGYGRDNTGDYVHMLRIAQGSLKELETQLMIASRVGWVDTTATQPALTICDEVGRMLRALIRSIEGNR